MHPSENQSADESYATPFAKTSGAMYLQCMHYCTGLETSEFQTVYSYAKIANFSCRCISYGSYTQYKENIKLPVSADTRVRLLLAEIAGQSEI